MKKIVFWGTPEFSVPSLKACLKKSEVIAVVTQPDKPKGRGHEVLPTPIKEIAIREKIKVFSPKSLRKLDKEGEALFSFLNQNNPDYLKSNDIINLNIKKKKHLLDISNIDLNDKGDFLRSHDIQFTIGDDIFQEVVCHNERLGGNDEVSKLILFI